MEDKQNVDIITNELLRLIPLSFIMSKEFDAACNNSRYKMPWMFSQITGPNVAILDVRTDEQKAEDNFIRCCNTISSNGLRAFYCFVVFIISLYHNQTNKKIDVKILRSAFKEMGISDFSDLNQFALDIPISVITEDEVLNWDDIKEDVKKLEADSYRAENTIDYQNIGNSCRVLLITVAQLVYDKTLHGALNKEGKKIGPSDTVGMLDNYFSHKLSGAKNEKLRAYAKSTNALANELTHKSTATKQDMHIALSATIHLIYLIGVIEGKLS